MELRECNVCHCVFPETHEFFPLGGKGNKGGLRPTCRECYNRKNRQRYHVNPRVKLDTNRRSRERKELENQPVCMAGLIIDEDRERELRMNVSLSRLPEVRRDIWAFRYRRDIRLLLKECEAWKAKYNRLVESKSSKTSGRSERA